MSAPEGDPFSSYRRQLGAARRRDGARRSRVEKEDRAASGLRGGGFFEGNWTADIEREAAGEVFERRMAIEKMCMDEADVVLTPGESMRKELAGRGVPEEKISLIPNGVDQKIRSGRQV